METEENMYRLAGLSTAALALAAVAFWTMLVSDPPNTEAETLVKYDVAEALKTTSKDAPVQDASVIACTYVFRDGHRCDGP